MVKPVSPQIDNSKTKPISSPEDDGATDVTSVLTEADIPKDDPEDFIYGDANGDGTIDVGDVVYLINYLHKDGPAPDPLEAGDANTDGKVDIGDVVYLIDSFYGAGSQSEFIRGDANGDGVIDVADLYFLWNYLYRGGPAPNPLAAGDFNCDGVVDIGDLVALMDYLFGGNEDNGISVEIDSQI